jgi:hypothetical protein
LRSSKITSASMKCGSRSQSIITVALTVTLIASTSMIHKFATIENFSLDSDTAVCNSTSSFEIKSVELVLIKQMSLKNYRVNKSIQTFVIYCKDSTHALSSIYNPELRNIQRISRSNILNCIISCVMYNSQRFAEDNSWTSLCSVLSVVKNICYLKFNSGNLSHEANMLSWTYAFLQLLD